MPFNYPRDPKVLVPWQDGEMLRVRPDGFGFLFDSK